MAYTSPHGYQNDVFVSYAHADDVPFPYHESDTGWVLNFVKDLEIALGRNLGTKEGEIPSIWKDEKLAKNIPLNTALPAEIKQSATFIVIMSPAYLRSDWCSTERIQFLQLLKDRGADNRVFIVETNDVDRAQYPKEIKPDLVPYKFWYRESGGEAQLIGMVSRRTEEYYKRVVEIASNLSDELKRIEDNTQKESKGCIFLAQATDDLDNKREDLKRYLNASGYKVLSEENLFMPEDLSVKNTRILENINQSLVYVQLLSDLPGKSIPNADEKMAKYQFELAKGNKNYKGKMLVWRTSNIDMTKLADPSLKAILESEYVRVEGFEDFKNAVLVAAIPPPPPLQRAQRDSKLLFICSDVEDKEYIEKIILTAITTRKEKKSAINSFFPLDEKPADPKTARQRYDDKILLCDAVLFVYCKSNPETVTSQLLYCMKTRQKPPFEIFGVFDGPPEPKDKLPIAIENENFIYMNCRNSMQEFDEKFLSVL